MKCPYMASTREIMQRVLKIQPIFFLLKYIKLLFRDVFLLAFAHANLGRLNCNARKHKYWAPGLRGE
jgi:hypothetical protein